MSQNTMQQADQTDTQVDADALVNDILSGIPETVVLETREEFEKRLTGMGPKDRKEQARARVKALAEIGVTEEDQQTERDFLKDVAKLSAGDFRALYTSSRVQQTAEVADPDGRPILRLDNELDGYTGLVKMIAEGVFPETYVRDGKLVHVEKVSGVRAANTFNTSTYQAKDITASVMRRLVATYTTTRKLTKAGYDSPLPTVSLCDAVISEPVWETLSTLHSLVDAPFVREDGTICQGQGYDAQTGMWLGLPEGYIPVPEHPTPAEVAAARGMVFGQVLGDFPFVSPADKANAVAFLVAPMIRNIIKCPVPLCIVNAHAPGSGKTLLVKIAIAMHGGGSWTFAKNNEEELRKQITTILTNQKSPIVNFDNVGRGSTIQSAALEQLLTEPVWKDRVLGGNSSVALPNDKAWAMTGNNLKVNTDIATRSFMIELDAKMERPDLRDTDEFELGDLEQWLLEPENRATLVRAMLVMILDWAAAGMPKIKKPKRSFTSWAEHIGGFLKHHGIDGFLGNEAAMAEADEEKQQDSLFLQQWLHHIGSERLTASELLIRRQKIMAEAHTGYTTMGTDPWHGTFPMKANDKPYSAVGLGRWLGARKGTPANGYVLQGATDPATSRAVWWVERMPDNPLPIPPQGAQEALI